MPNVLNKPATVLGTTILHGATVFIVKLASGVITFVCEKNLKMSKKNKHSPAPWRYEQKIAGEYCVLDKKGTTIASTDFFPQFNKEAKANAALISYAPEMYGLLQRIQNEYFDYSNTLAPRYQIENAVKGLLKRIEDETRD